MFGYITPLKMELKVKEFEYFRSYYHGLCYTIKNNFGNIPRLTLNYDMTFIGFLLDGLSNDLITIKDKRCIKHPTYDIKVIDETLALNYVANLSIIFFNYKLEDNIKDDNSKKSKVFNLFLSPFSKRASNSYNSISNIIKRNLENLSLLEKNKHFNSLDEICHPFSDTMASILKDYPYTLNNDSEKLRDNLYTLGYLIGKYIYIMDAFDDIEDDIMDSQFNPLLILYKLDKDNYKKFSVAILEDLEFNILSCISNLTDIINKLDFVKHKDIIENIIKLGMTNKFYEICNKTIEKNTS